MLLHYLIAKFFKMIKNVSVKQFDDIFPGRRWGGVVVGQQKIMKYRL